MNQQQKMQSDGRHIIAGVAATHTRTRTSILASNLALWAVHDRGRAGQGSLRIRRRKIGWCHMDEMDELPHCPIISSGTY